MRLRNLLETKNILLSILVLASNLGVATAEQLVLIPLVQGSATDRGVEEMGYDGIFDDIGIPPNDRQIYNNGWQEARFAFEYDTSALPSNASVVSANLQACLGVFLDEALLPDPQIREVQLHGYDADGIQTLDDYVREGLIETKFLNPTGDQLVSYDVASHVRSIVGNSKRYAGYSFREIYTAPDPNYLIIFVRPTCDVSYPRLVIDFEIALNSAPVLDPIGSQWAFSNDLLTFTVSATDPENDSLIYNASNLPNGATFDPLTRVFEWTPTGNQVDQTFSVNFSVSDGELSDSENIAIQVFGSSIRKARKKKTVRKTRIKAEIKEQKLYATYEFDALSLESGYSLEIVIVNPIPESLTVDVTTFDPCPDTPSTFKLGEQCFDISTPGNFESAGVCLTYDETLFADESTLRFLHYDRNAGGWIDSTTGSVDVVNNRICANVTGFSPFMLASSNAPPSIIAIEPSVNPVALNTDVNLRVIFDDPDDFEGFNLTYNWGDGSSNSNTNALEFEDFSTHQYSEPGVYTVTVTVADKHGSAVEKTYNYIVVFDPTAGFVTGGGWIESPSGAYTFDPTLTGKAIFGFNAKYRKGASVPDGSTQFQFKTGDLNFDSDSYHWLVVSGGGSTAQFKGVGAINGAYDDNGNPFGFMIWAQDGEFDTFRIRIWTELNGLETDVFDNGFDQSLGGGSIVIHTGGK